MLDLMRKHAGTWLIKFILGAVILVFVFWGVGSYRTRKGSRVAVVNGNTISIEQYREAYNRILDQLRNRFGDSLNEEMIKMFNVRRQALDAVIEQALLVGEAKRLQFRVTDEALADFIKNAPAFQNNGRFDPALYRRVLNLNRMTPETFESVQREALLIGKLRSFVDSGVKVSETEVREWYNWQNASVNIAYVHFNPEAFQDIQIEDASVRDYYDEHRSSYKTEPLIKVRYLRFDAEAYVPQVDVSETEVREYYETHPEAYDKPETVEARHILIKTGSNAPPDEVQAARKKAIEAMERVKSGEDFGEVAKAVSEGPTGPSGGYLGTFRKEEMVAPFAEKAFSMQPGDVSEPVRTRFGWHVIKVESIQPASRIAMADAAAAIREQLARERAKEMAYDDAAAVFDATFDQEDLAQIAAQWNLAVQTTDFFGKEGPEKGVKSPARFAAAAFELKPDEISDIQEIEDVYYILQPVEEIPAKIPELETVIDRVKADLREHRRDEAAQTAAADFLNAVKNGQEMAAAAQSRGLALQETGLFKRSGNIPGIGAAPELSRAAFRLSDENPWPEKAVKGNKGYYVIRFKERKLPEEKNLHEQRESIEGRLTAQKKNRALRALIEDIRARSEISIAEEYREQPDAHGRSAIP